MNANLTSRWSLNLSGTRLFLILAVGLGTAALALDGGAGRLSEFGASLSLPFWVCTLVTAAVGYVVVPLLRSLKAGQFIREDGPQAHLKKAGTPTMGGAFFVPVAAVVALLWTGFNANAIAVSLLTLGYGAIGGIDDWQKLRNRKNDGISPQMKLILQTSLGALFCLWMAWSQPAGLTTIALPFGLSLPLGLLFWPFAVGVLVAESNALNLTDGLDGLAGGTGAIALLGLGALAAPVSPELMVFCACLSGSCLGFLVHNHNPATVFMGDTGSMALGGAVTGVALLTNNLWALLVIGGLFFVETLSVMAQVGYYKATKGPDGVGKRLLKMAPLHHHLELSGWSETKVVGVFYLVGALLAIFGFFVH